MDQTKSLPLVPLLQIINIVPYCFLGYVAFQNLPPPPVVREQIRDFQSNPFGVIPANAFSTESPAVQALRTEREVVTKTVPLEIPKPQQPFVFVTQRPNIVNPFITTSQKELPISYTHIPLQPTSAPHVFSYNTHGYDPEDYKDYKDDHRSNEFTGTHSSIYGYHPGDEANSIGFDPDVIDENKFVFNDYPTIKLTTSTTTPRPSAPSTNYDLSSLFVREQAPPPPVPTYVTRNKGTESPRTFSGHPISQVPGP